MAPRGVSAEEKRTRLLEIFHETKDFYQLKELEKIAPRMKGIVTQSVKDVLQSLVDDALVQGDKIGASNFFWSFPSQRGAMIQNRLKAVTDTQSSLQAQLEDLQSTVQLEKAARPGSSERDASLSQLLATQRELEGLKQELSQYGACDPAVIEEKKRAIVLAKEACLRWTDNYSVLLTYFTRQHGVEAEEVRKHLGIGEDYEDFM